MREDNIRKLISIGDNYELEKLEGVHPDLGKINGLQLISTWAVHDQTHIYQIARNLTSNFVHNVGPWKSYLRIVNQNEYD